MQFHQRNVKLVYGGGTVGLMGELAKTLVSLSGPEAVHGIIPKALIQVEEGYQDYSPGQSLNGTMGKIERVIKETDTTGSEFGMISIVPDMHTRKRLMADKVLEGGPGSGFISLAGGFGTIEEVMEMTTWNQLGIHRTGIVLLNINGYWDHAIAWVAHAVEEGFISQENANILIDTKAVDQALIELKEYQLSKDRLDLTWGGQ